MDTNHIPRGTPVYINDGELAFDMAINTKKDVGTHKGVFLEPLGCDTSKVINSRGRVQAVDNKLVSRCNL